MNEKYLIANWRQLEINKQTNNTQRRTYLLEVNFVDLEARFKNTACKYTAAEDVLLSGRVIGPLDYIHLIKEVFSAIY